MTGEPVQGFVLYLYKKALDTTWPSWSKLKEVIVAHFMLCSQPVVTLQKLQGMHQDDQLINDFITNFLDLKLEVQILDDFAQHIMLQSMDQALLKKTILKYGEPTSFGTLISKLHGVSHDIEYLQTVRPTVTNEIKEMNKFQDVQFARKCCTCKAVGHQAMWCPKRTTKEPHVWQASQQENSAREQTLNK